MGAYGINVSGKSCGIGNLWLDGWLIFDVITVIYTNL